jgi:GT2 family glycosyltransferase/glycosyltransferase involved in cell wall biosynthesis
MKNAWRILRQLPLLLLSPFLLLLQVLALYSTDLAWKLFGTKRKLDIGQPYTNSASVVIPNWNGRDLLEKYLPSVVEALKHHPDNEVIVVDNGSTDGSAEYLTLNFPTVKVLALPENLGFGGGSNSGFAAAKNDIVVLLNSDMRVAPNFLAPLLNAFDAPDIFAVSCQIFFSDPNKLREETGLTEGRWSNGMLRVRHRIDKELDQPYPCFYGGGGSCAFDRRKFLALGSFDEILKPFYLEDTDLGYLAWKSGWRVLYQPKSHVWHEHRGTIGKKFSRAYIESVLYKNFALFVWKNIHEPRALAQHFTAAYTSAFFSMIWGNSLERANFAGLFRATLQLHETVAARWRARGIAQINDEEAFLRHQGAYYRDRYEAPAETNPPLRVLMVSPYPLSPPSHGGAVFMQQTIRELSKHAQVHLIALLDDDTERHAHLELAPYLETLDFLVRMPGQSAPPFTYLPSAVLEFSNPDLEYLIHRTIREERINVLQLEYTHLAQYGCRFNNLVCALFEHDVYFQSISRQIRSKSSLLFRIPATLEYLKAFRWELKQLPKFDQVQVCTPANEAYLASLDPSLKPKLKSGLRAAIEVNKYTGPTSPRVSKQLLFLGGFRHLPNLEALQWFFKEVAPLLISRNVDFKVIAIGADPPPLYSFANAGETHLELKGFVEDLTPYWHDSAVFLCPILSGSGVRVKLLEAFAAGTPVVSTRVGAEGLAANDGEFCRLADTPQAFAIAIEETLAHPGQAFQMSQRARLHVESQWDNNIVTARLASSLRQLLATKHCI